MASPSTWPFGTIYRPRLTPSVSSAREGEHQAARDAAAHRGLDEAALIHEWVKEKLDHR